MKTRFFADYDLKELKSRLKSIIEVENEDNLITHFRQSILFKDECTLLLMQVLLISIICRFKIMQTSRELMADFG